MKEIYGYTRVSTQKQGEGVSLVEQKSAIAEYALKQGFLIIEWFEEKQTAAKTGRPEFCRMMKLLRQAKADGVIFHKIDRSSRNFHDWGVISDLQDQGAEIHFAADNSQLSTRSEHLAAGMQVVIAADFIRNLREETKKGQVGRLKQGIWPNHAPIGYIDEGKGKAKSVDKQKAPLIKQAFELYATGEYSLKSLLAKMNILGLRNTVGNPIEKNGMNRILRNPFYMGDMYYKSLGKVYRGAHIPIISRVLFAAVQNVIDGKGNLSRTKHDYIYRKQLTCGFCQYTIVSERQKGKVYYRCQTKNCGTKTIREDVLESFIFPLVDAIDLPDKYLQNITARLEESQIDTAQRSKNKRQALELQYAQINSMYKRLTDSYLRDIISESDYLERKNQYEQDKKLIEEKKNQAENDSQSKHLVKKLEKLKTLSNTYKMASKRKKRDFMKMITSNCELVGKNPVFKLKEGYSNILNQNVIPSCTLHRDEPRTICGKCVLTKRTITDVDGYANELIQHISSLD